MKDNYLVSCIIATKNEEKNLPILLDSIKKQNFKEIEVVVVDNASTDKTKELAKKAFAKVFDHGPERSPQRNFGAEKSQGEYLLFLDGDMELEMGVVEQCLEKVGEGEFKAVIIPERSVGDGFWAKAKALERQTYLGDPSIEAPRFFARDAFFEVGGYDESLIAAEDWDLKNRIKEKGFKIGRIQEKIIHHEGNLSFFTSVKKKFYYGQKISKYFAKRNFKASQLSPIRPSYLKHWQLFLTHPLTTIGFIILKVGELIALSLGLILSSLKLTR